MASDVQICNIALAHLGDTATVASLNPPEGSAQAEHCARFYPVARDAVLELHAWSFATRRIVLPLLNTTNPQWRYVYAMPNDNINIIAVISNDAPDDYSVKFTVAGQYGYNPEIIPSAGSYVPQPYHIEMLADGTQAIMTNQENAVLRYTYRCTNTSQYSPLFVMSLTWYLASMLAGPILKGDVGAAEGKRCLEMFYKHLVEATQSDAVQRDIKPKHVVPWMAGR